MTDIIKRLSELEKELFRDVWADVTYKDAHESVSRCWTF